MDLQKQIIPDCRLEYRIENETVRITGNRLSNDDLEIIIPGRIGSLPVTEIGAGAFRKCDRLISVTLPDSVKTIGESAFTGCSNLKEIRLPAELSSIESFAFEGCGKLAALSIPFGVTRIGGWAFRYCESLQ